MVNKGSNFGDFVRFRPHTYTRTQQFLPSLWAAITFQDPVPDDLEPSLLYKLTPLAVVLAILTKSRHFKAKTEEHIKNFMFLSIFIVTCHILTCITVSPLK